MTAGQICLGLKRGGYKTLPPSVLAVLCACQRLASKGQPITLKRLHESLGWSSPTAAKEAMYRLVAEGLVRKEGYAKSGWAVACVFIPGERR